MEDYDEPITKEEYEKLANSCGQFDKIDIDFGYRLYLADMSGDEVEIARAQTNWYWIAYFKALGMLN